MVAMRPTADSARALAPDLARGFMLLFIALAHAHAYLDRPPMLAGYPLENATIDKISAWLTVTFVDSRAIPMFALLLGYGVAHIVRRQGDLPPKDLRRLLWRRAAAFIVIGFLHCILLAGNDILTAYGGMLLIGACIAMVYWPDRYILLFAVVFLGPLALPAVSHRMISTDPPPLILLPPDVVTAVTERTFASIVLTIAGPVIIGSAFSIGLLTGRHSILEHPERYVKLLRVTAVVGIGAAVLGAQPIALVVTGVVEAPRWAIFQWFGPLDTLTGIMGGFGYAAVVGLVALQLKGRRVAAVDAISATGRRSMTCYIAQSVVWMIVYTPFLLNMSTKFTVSTAMLLGFGTWLLTVAMADWMRRTGRRGPFEILLRRVTYRPST